jgi:outer membrane receptor for ferrienterochelin and colicin
LSNIKNGLCTKGLMFLYCLSLAVNCFADGSAEPLTENRDDASYYQKSMMSIAAGHPTPENISPGVTSVITSEDIDRIGARRVTDVLEYLPGVHVSTSRSGFNIIGFRGLYSEANQQVLVMINGTPIRNALFGGKSYEWDMPVKNISHIEVIRGAGSMLYGADATSGVINIITKKGRDLNGGDAGGFFGSQNTYEGWGEYGQKQGDWEYAFALQGGSTTGNKGRVDQDAQTLIDRQFGSSASNAPGFTNNGREDMDARLDVAYKDQYRLRSGYQRFNKVQTGVGTSFALDNLGSANVDLYTADLTAKSKFTDDFSADSKYYFYGEEIELDRYALPPGTFGGLLPLGARNQVNGFIGSTGISTQLNYTGLKKHVITAGTGLNYYWTTPNTNKVNFIITPTFVQQIPLTEVSSLGNDPLNKSDSRYNTYALAQDEWNFATDWYLTAGFRYDYYSDVADGFSPRLSLVWNVSPYMTTKLLYSRAFRAPSFLELKQPFIPGAQLKPETINTVEFQIENKWSTNLKTSANAYWFEFENFISSLNTNAITPVGYINNSTINGVGVETEVNYRLRDSLNIAVNYSYHGITNNTNTGLLPEHMAKGLLNWEFSPGWSIGSQLDWIGERRRGTNDTRTNLNDYFVMGLTLSTKIAKPLELTLRANNILGVNAKEASLNPTLLPGDIPVNERSILGQIKWSF